MKYKKTCFKNSVRKLIFFFDNVCVPENIHVLWVTSQGFINKELKKEWKNGIDGLNGRCRDLLLQKHCKKLFNLMDIFLCVIKYIEVDVNWLLKVKSHLDKLEKIQSQFKRKKLKKMSTIHYLREWFLRDLMRTFRFSNSEMFLTHLVILNFQTLRIFTTLLQLIRVAVMILPMLEKLKQTFVFGLIIIKVNINFFKGEKGMYHGNVFIHTIFKIAKEILMIAK